MYTFGEGDTKRKKPENNPMCVFLRGEAREDQWTAEIHRGASAHLGRWKGRTGSVPEVGQDEKSFGVHNLQPGAEWNPCQVGWGNKVVKNVEVHMQNKTQTLLYFDAGVRM